MAKMIINIKPVTPRDELAALITNRLIKAGVLPEQARLAADAVACEAHTVYDHWTENDISGIGDYPGSKLLRSRQLVASWGREARQVEIPPTTADRSVT